MTAAPGSSGWISQRFISLRIGRPRISTKLEFYMQIMIIYCILEMNEHEHKRLIWRLKHNRFLALFKEMSYSLRCSMRHKLVVYKVLINVLMASSMFPCLYLNNIFEPILILLQFLKVPIL